MSIKLALCTFFALTQFANAQTVNRYSSPDGHDFLYYEMEGAARTAIAVDWKTGLSSLPAGQEAGSQIGINLMLNGGGGGRTPSEIVADFEDLDAGSQLFVQPDKIRGFIVAPNHHLGSAGEMANDVLAEPAMEARWFERERATLSDNSRGRDKFVWGKAWLVARQVMLGDHPTNNFWSLSPIEGLEAVTLDSVKSWHKDAFGTGSTEIVAAGSASAQDVGKAIDRALVNLPEKAGPAPTFAPKLNIPGKTIVIHAPDAEKSLIMALGSLPPLTAGLEHQTNLAVGVLGFGKQSRLFKAVRTSLRAAYRYGAWFDDFTKQGRTLSLGGEVDTELLEEAFETTWSTYEDYRKDGIGRFEFPFAARFYRQRIEGSLEKPEEAAFLMIEGKAAGHPDDHVLNIVEQIRDQDRAATNSFIREYFPAFEQMLKIVVTPNAQSIESDCVILSVAELSDCFAD